MYGSNLSPLGWTILTAKRSRAGYAVAGNHAKVKAMTLMINRLVRGPIVRPSSD